MPSLGDMTDVLQEDHGLGTYGDLFFASSAKSYGLRIKDKDNKLIKWHARAKGIMADHIAENILIPETLVKACYSFEADPKYEILFLIFSIKTFQLFSIDTATKCFAQRASNTYDQAM